MNVQEVNTINYTLVHKNPRNEINNKKKNWISNNISLLLILTTLIVLFIIIILLITHHFNQPIPIKHKKVTSNKATTQTIATTQIQTTPSITETPVPTPDSNSLPVVSPNTVEQNGVGYFSDTTIKFNFLLADPSNNNSSNKVIVSNNRICINDIKLDCYGAPFIELFPKKASDTIQQAIQKTFLNGYNLYDCTIVPFPPPTPTPPKPTPTPTSGPTIPTYTYTPTPTPSPFVPQGWASASINYAQLKGYYGDATPNNFDSTKCPETFTSEGGSSNYFEVDPNHPSFIIFLVVGNGLIWSDNTKESFWFQTIQFIN